MGQWLLTCHGNDNNNNDDNGSVVIPTFCSSSINWYGINSPSWSKYQLIFFLNELCSLSFIIPLTAVDNVNVKIIGFRFRILFLRPAILQFAQGTVSGIFPRQ
jgi:hypothetical protein